MMNQAICIDGLFNHLLCTMQCHLNGVHTSEVPKFLAEAMSETTHALLLVNPFNATNPLIIPLQLNRVTIYFDVYTSSIAKYENEDIPEIHLTAEEPPWNQSTNEYSEIETHMFDHQGQISIPATAAREPVYVSIVVSCSMTHG